MLTVLVFGVGVVFVLVILAAYLSMHASSWRQCSACHLWVNAAGEKKAELNHTDHADGRGTLCMECLARYKSERGCVDVATLLIVLLGAHLIMAGIVGSDPAPDGAVLPTPTTKI